MKNMKKIFDFLTMVLINVLTNWKLDLKPLFLITLSFISVTTQAEVIDPPYTIESAVYNIKINADASSEQTDEVTKKINNQLAVTLTPNTTLYYNAEQESIKVLEAYTILPDGKHIAVTKNNIHVKDAEGSGSSTIDDAKVLEIIYPNLVVGSKLHYKTIKKEHKARFKNQYDMLLVFDPHKDKRYVEYNIQYPKSLKLYFDAKDVAGGRISDAKNGQLRYQYTYSHPQAYKEEDNETSFEDFAPHLHISTMSDPLALGKLLKETLESKAKVTPEIQALADNITLGIDDEYQQVKALYNWASKEIRYVADFVGGNDYIPHDASYILQKRFGDCKDHNNLLLTLLKAKNITASSALVNAGNAYKLTQLGSFNPFNHVITYLPKWDMYVDSTQGLAMMGNLDFDTIDKPALLPELNAIGHTKGFSPQEQQVINLTLLEIQADGSIKGSVDTHYSGSEELPIRQTFATYQGQDKAKIEKSYFSAAGETGRGSFTLSDVYDLNTPFKVHGDFLIDPLSNMPGTGALTVPFGLSDSHLKNGVNDKRDEKIEFPYDCRSYYTEDTTEIAFPNNVKVFKLPEDANFKDNGVEYHSTYKLESNKVSVKRSLLAQRPTAVCNSKDNETWLAFHKVLARDIRGQIIYE